MLTTTIGAYPKPDTVPVLDWFSAEAEADPIAPTRSYTTTLAEGGSALAAILDRATEEVVREQDEFGIDIPTDGEIRRENYIHYHCRRLSGFDFQRLSEKTMRGHYEHCFQQSWGRWRRKRLFSCAIGRWRRGQLGSL